MSACIYYNRKYYIEYLACTLCYGDKDNSLEESLFVILSSTEFIAVTRVMCILMVAVSQLMRYLVGCSHTFGQYGWSNRHMSKQFDVLEKHLLYLVDHQENFLDKDFMLNIFGEAREQLPPFNEFLTYKYGKKQQRCIKGLGDNTSHVKVVPYKLLIDKLFNPQDEANKQTNDYISDIIPRILNAFIKELHDPKKSTSSHLSSQDGALSSINSAGKKYKIELEFMLLMISANHHLVF